VINLIVQRSTFQPPNNHHHKSDTAACGVLSPSFRKCYTHHVDQRNFRSYPPAWRPGNFRGSSPWSVSCPSAVHTLSQCSNRTSPQLAVGDDGFITHFRPVGSPESIELLRDHAAETTAVLTGSFLLPTFCDLHLHAPQFLYQGNGLDLPLMQWLDEYALRAEERLDADKILAKRVYERLARRLLQNGTGTVMLFGTIEEETK